MSIAFYFLLVFFFFFFFPFFFFRSSHGAGGYVFLFLAVFGFWNVFSCYLGAHYRMVFSISDVQREECHG